MAKRTYTIGKNGKTAKIRLTGHTQHIWHTSIMEGWSMYAIKKIRKNLGNAPYDNPCGHFGTATKITWC